jgi:RES domain-containing protein
LNIRAWRIVKAKYAASALSGEGARKYGGRWNTPGVAVVYAAGSLSLAILEMLVHLQSHELLGRYVSFEVAFDSGGVEDLDLTKLPKRWRKSPPPTTVQRLGDAWATSGKSCILRVPSSIVPAESNYLINPKHPDFAGVSHGPKQPIRFDPRLIKSP